MRVGRGVGLVLALTLGACRASAPSAPADAGLPPPPTTPTGPGCDALFPPDVRELALPSFAMKEDRACATCGPLCTFHSDAEPGTTISLAYNCDPKAPSMDVRELLAPTLKAGGVEVPALGRAAARRTPVPGMLQVVAWDDDTPCALVVTWLGNGPERAVDVTRSALMAVSAASLAAARTPDAGTPPTSTEDAGTLPSPTEDAGTLLAPTGVPLTPPAPPSP
ncbi:hypothetical protein [Hyalangium versicolor]|uniref:hypothetical protein n=1 Tax=Hyalangium versicolor TaxID=2861190 RepID=UPI001CCE47C1|nr:hypothetical protein [Hyalangium versicolor]